MKTNKPKIEMIAQFFKVEKLIKIKAYVNAK